VHIDRRLLGWGAFLIIVGAIPLLVRGGYLDAGLVDEWPSLWPILLIGWGLGLVLRRTPGELLGSAISVVVLGVMVGGLISTGFGVSRPSAPAARGRRRRDGLRQPIRHARRERTRGHRVQLRDPRRLDGRRLGLVAHGYGPGGNGPDVEADFRRADQATR
jgi:hypothetical protein